MSTVPTDEGVVDDLQMLFERMRVQEERLARIESNWMKQKMKPKTDGQEACCGERPQHRTGTCVSSTLRYHHLRSIPFTVNEAGYCVGDRIKVVKKGHKYFGKVGIVKRVTRCHVHFAIDGRRHEVFPCLGAGSVLLCKAAIGTDIVQTANGCVMNRHASVT